MIVVEIGVDRDGATSFATPWREGARCWTSERVGKREAAQFALERLVRERRHYEAAYDRNGAPRT